MEYSLAVPITTGRKCIFPTTKTSRFTNRKYLLR